ncbi:hypothetical protein [Staphylococcus debuckii]|uniref:hypothetical protein n=1 Tax=Staphylococcus debuckii TaxID=2044912 RepID=UPI000F436DE3|nr:hypothetical protein [Staphylococcus debuckii]AYU55582.1 hypothetical protein CNQ82_09000 [Staphylococcus debuckii]
MKKITVFITSIIVLAILCITLLVTTFTYKNKVETLETKVNKQEKKIKDQKEAIDAYEKFVKEKAKEIDQNIDDYYTDQANEVTDGKYQEWKDTILKGAKDNGGDSDETAAEMNERLEKENRELQESIDKAWNGNDIEE